MTIIKYLLSLNRYSRNGKKTNNPQKIVLHHNENDEYGAIETRNYFENLKNGKNAIYYSTHYIIGSEGEIIYCVPEEEVAYHRGNSEESCGSIAITCCNNSKKTEFSRNSLYSLKELVRDITKRYGLNIMSDLQRHYDVSGIKCPSYYATNGQKWEELKREIRNDMEMEKHMTENSDKIAERLSCILGADKSYIKTILLGEGRVDTEIMLKIVKVLERDSDINRNEKR